MAKEPDEKRQKRLAKKAQNEKDNRNKGSEAEKATKRANNAERMRIKRAAEKAANDSQNLQNNDFAVPGSSTDSPEDLAMVRKRKSVSYNLVESQEEKTDDKDDAEVIANVKKPKRGKLSKRKNPLPGQSLNEIVTQSSGQEKTNANHEQTHCNISFLKHIIDEIICNVIPKPKSRRRKRLPHIGRKSKATLKFNEFISREDPDQRKKRQSIALENYHDSKAQQSDITSERKKLSLQMKR